MTKQKQTSKSATLSDNGISLDQKQLHELISLTEQITHDEGTTKTGIDFLSVCRHSYQAPLVPSVLNPSLCLILQGMKSFHLGEDLLYYHVGDYLASIIDIPASGQIIGATKDSPYIGLRLDFTAKEIASLVIEADINVKQRNAELGPAAFIGKSDAEFLELLIRLLKLIDRPEEVRFLSGLIKRELIFHLLTGDYGHLFLQQGLFNQQADGIGKAIGWIKDNYARSFAVEDLAKLSNMSVSGLHHKFKAITTMGPLQYQKQLRLLEARRLMLSGEDASTAALEVGYESPSQFSREYRRLFGLPPAKDIKTVRQNSIPGR
ncbi:MAG TPA: AraC family transcriptional regulator [Firmicutes bacterium]|nr:AraC family transcriptional regulator [Bacillota bacterium]